MNTEIKIVADSSADLTSFTGTDFASAPLKIITSQNEYVDDKNLDVEGMVNELIKYSGKSSTACPSPIDWLKAFGSQSTFSALPLQVPFRAVTMPHVSQRSTTRNSILTERSS